MNTNDQFAVNSDLQACLTEMNLISQRKNPGPDAKRRFQYLSQRVAALRSGFTPLELDQQKLREIETQAGYPRTVFERNEIPAEKRAILHWLRTGQESRDVLKGDFTPPTFSGLGSFVDPTFWGDQGVLPRALKAFDSILDPQVSTIIETENAKPLQIPWEDDVSNPADLLSESSADSEADPSGGQLVLGGYTFRTPRIRFSLEWQDVEAGYGLLQILEASAATRLALGTSRYATTGSGVNQPLGIVTACQANGAVVSAAGNSAIVRADLEKLYFSVNAAYRNSALWLCNDNTLQKIRQLADTVTRPLLDLDRGGNDIGEGLQIFGKPVLVSPSMDNVGASKFPLLFGNCKYFIIRRAKSAERVQIYKEALGLIEKGMLAMRFFQRFDSGLIVPASGSPVQILQMAS